MARRRTRRESGSGSAGIKRPISELSLPLSAVTTVHIELCGNREAIVEGCHGVLEYSDSRIRLNTGKLTVGFSGAELCIGTFQLEQTVIRGNIASIDFSN